MKGKHGRDTRGSANILCIPKGQGLRSAAPVKPDDMKSLQAGGLIFQPPAIKVAHAERCRTEKRRQPALRLRALSGTAGIRHVPGCALRKLKIIVRFALNIPEQTPWYLYMVECENGSIYTGIATDVASRFQAHASGKGAKYTRAHKPRMLLLAVRYPDRSTASRAEYQFKQLTASQKRMWIARGIALADAQAEQSLP